MQDTVPAREAGPTNAVAVVTTVMVGIGAVPVANTNPEAEGFGDF
jgi:hypothetical protein